MQDKGYAWDLTYLAGQTPWDTGKPIEDFVKLIESKKLKPGKHLDVGCGTGTNVIYFAKNGFDSIGVDISRVAIERAKEKASKANVNTKFFVGDVLDLSFLDGKFDLITDLGCFHHQEEKDYPKFLKQITNKLKTGGTYLLVCFSKNDKFVVGPYKFSESDIRKIFSKKFVIKNVKEFAAEAKGLDFRPILWFVHMVKK